MARLLKHSCDVTGLQVAYRPFYLWTRPTLEGERKNLKLDGL